MNSTTFFLSKTMYVTLVRISMVHVQQEKFKLHWSQCPLVSWIKIWDDFKFVVYAEARTQMRDTYSRRVY